MPGIGRQDGDVEAAVRSSFTGDPASCLIGVAGAIIYADDPRRAAVGWWDRIRRAAEDAESGRASPRIRFSRPVTSSRWAGLQHTRFPATVVKLQHAHVG